MFPIGQIAYAAAAYGLYALRSHTTRRLRRRHARPAALAACLAAGTAATACMPVGGSGSARDGVIRVERGRFMAGTGRYTLRPGAVWAGEVVGFGWDRTAERWIQRECEWRVSAGGPYAAADSVVGGRPSVSLDRHDEDGVASTAIGRTAADGPYRAWRHRAVVDEGDMRGQTQYGLTLRAAGAPDSTAYWPIPTPGDTPPDTWTAWRAPSHVRDAEFGWWKEAHGAPPPAGGVAAAAGAPVAMRCRWYHVDEPVSVRDP